MNLNNKMNKFNMKKVLSKFANITIVLFAYAFGIVLTFYVNNGYFDIMRAKAGLFFNLVKIFFPFILITLMTKLIINRKQIKPSFFDLSLLLFLCTSFISTVNAFSLNDALTGMQGWYVGFITISFLILSVLTFNNECINNAYFFVPLLVAAVLEYILIICDGMDLDILGFKRNLPETSNFIYFGTIGNCNWVVGFFALSVPFFINKYLLESKRWKYIVYLICCVLGIVSSVINGADGIYISYFMVMFFLIPVAFDSLKRIRKLSVLFFIVSFILIMINYDENFYSFLIYFNSIGKKLIDPSFMIIILIFSIVLFGISISFKENKYQKNKKRIIKIVYSITLLFLVSGFIRISKTQSDFDSNRFALWEYSLNAFKKYPIFMKLFGVGPELLRNVYASFSVDYGVIYNSSHSEPIQTIMTMGIFGLLSWTLCWISLFISYFKSKGNIVKDGIFVSLFAYFAQSFVNSATILNLCIVSISIIYLFRNEDENKIEI